jgi:hypothetical protein
MQRKYKDLASKGKISIGKCLEIIRNELSTCENGYLRVGNSYLYNENNVTLLVTGANKPVELYSKDGYTSLDDIANWADIVEDVKNCYAAGNEKYSMLWNVSPKTA